LLARGVGFVTGKHATCTWSSATPVSCPKRATQMDHVGRSTLSCHRGLMQGAVPPCAPRAGCWRTTHRLEVLEANILKADKKSDVSVRLKFFISCCSSIEISSVLTIRSFVSAVPLGCDLVPRLGHRLPCFPLSRPRSLQARNRAQMQRVAFESLNLPFN
jgi:hypothetical protein